MEFKTIRELKEFEKEISNIRTMSDFEKYCSTHDMDEILFAIDKAGITFKGNIEAAKILLRIFIMLADTSLRG